MTRLVRAEFLKLRTTQVWFWLLLATIAISALVVVGQMAGSGSSIRTPGDVPQLWSGFAQTPGYILVFVLGVLGVTTEFRYQTITPTVLTTPSRWTIVTAKMITYALTGVAFAVVAVAVEFAVGLPWLASRDIAVHWGSGPVVHSIVGTLLVIALFGIVGLGFGALLRNQIVGVVVGIIFLLVLENILVAIPVVKHAWPYTPNGAVQAIVYTPGGGNSDTANGVHLLPGWAGVIVLLLWAFVPAIVGAGYTMNRDIT